MAVEQPCILVGGPIQNAIGPDGSFHEETRTKIESLVHELRLRGLSVLSAHVYENFGEMDVTGQFQKVCSRDFEWMCRCDVFVAVLPLDGQGRVISSSGTAVELGWASALKKPIVLVCDPAPKYSHLVIGLDAVATVTTVDINRDDVPQSVFEAVLRFLDRSWEQSKVLT